MAAYWLRNLSNPQPWAVHGSFDTAFTCIKAPNPSLVTAARPIRKAPRWTWLDSRKRRRSDLASAGAGFLGTSQPLGSLTGSSITASGRATVWDCPTGLSYPFPCPAYRSCSTNLYVALTRRGARGRDTRRLTVLRDRRTGHHCAAPCSLAWGLNHDAQCRYGLNCLARSPMQEAHGLARYTGAGASGRHPRPRKGLRPPRERS